jgi:hypothetical protein
MRGRAVVHVHPPARVSARKRAYKHPAQAGAHTPRRGRWHTARHGGTAIANDPPPQPNIS